MGAKRNVVVLTADAAIFPAAAFLATRLAALNLRSDTEIVLVSDSLSHLQAASDFGVPAALRAMAKVDQILPAAASRVSAMSFVRLLLPETFGPEVERILYLDVDIAMENATPFALFDIDMKGHAIAAVRDLYFTFSGLQDTVRKRVVGNKPYLQAGVLLIDRDRYLRTDLRRRAFSAAMARRSHDQTALNVALHGDWLELSPAMNLIANAVHSFVGRALPPAIIHFWGKIKPWHSAFAETHGVRANLLAYLKTSPWSDFARDRINLQSALHVLTSGRGQPTLRKIKATAPARMPPTTDMGGLARFLRDTSFADVEAGITPFFRDAIPEIRDPAASPRARRVL